MRPARILSLLLAVVLQLTPVLRFIVPSQGAASSAWAIILRLGAGLAATLGSYNAVSGATNLIPNGATYNLKVGITTNLIIGYSGVHTPASFSASPNPVCPGMTLNNASGTSTRITGTPTATGTYSSTVTAWENNNFSGRSVSATYTFVVAAGPPPPIITNFTLSAAPPVAPGGPITLSPVIGGTPPYTYRWYYNGLALFGATNSSLAIPNVQATNGGLYTLIVQDTAFGSATNSTNLIVSSAPVVTAQPIDRYVANNGTAIFAVSAGGLTPFKYQWRRNGTNLPNATNATLTVSPSTAASAGIYSVTISNALGGVVSGDAYLRISPSSTSFTVPLVAMRGPWRYLSTGTNLKTSWREFDFIDSTWPSGNGILAVEASANTAVFPFIGTTLALNSGGHFVTNFYFRNHFTITNRSLLSGIILSNVIDDGSVTYFNGTEVSRFNMPAGEILATTFAVGTATEGVYSTSTLPIASVIEGDNVLAIEVHQADTGSSDVVMGAALFATYLRPNTVPIVLTNPVSTVAPVGNAVTFTAAADGAGLAFRWYHDGVLLPSAQTSSLTLNAVDTPDNGGYTFVASNSFGSATSQVAILTVAGGTPPSIVNDPADAIVPSGSNTTFIVNATGTGLAYFWRYNSNVLANANSSTLQLANLSSTQSGFYSVIVSNNAGAVTSREARLLVVPPPQAADGPRLATVANASQFGLSFNAQPGFRYIVQSSPTVDGPNWTTVTNIAPSFNGGPISIQQSFSDGPQRFLRVLVTF